MIGWVDRWENDESKMIRRFYTEHAEKAEGTETGEKIALTLPLSPRREVAPDGAVALPRWSQDHAAEVHDGEAGFADGFH